MGRTLLSADVAVDFDFWQRNTKFKRGGQECPPPICHLRFRGHVGPGDSIVPAQLILIQKTPRISQAE